MDSIPIMVMIKRCSDTDMESTTNDQPENTFKVHASSLRSRESHFMVAEEDLQQISQLHAIIANNPAFTNPHVIFYYFDRNDAIVQMPSQAEFDIFLSTRIDSHIYVQEVPPNLSELMVTICDTWISFEFEIDRNEFDEIMNTSTDSDLSTGTESDFEDLDGEELNGEALNGEAFNPELYVVYAVRAG